MAGQNFLFGLLLPRSQFLTVPGLIPSRFAKSSRDRQTRKLASCNDLANDSRPEPQGGGSTRAILITRWQKGFESHPFRHVSIACCVCQCVSSVSNALKLRRKRGIQ